MLPKIDLPRALLRGRYMVAGAKIEFAGTPIDDEVLHLLRANWQSILARLVVAVDRDYGVYVPTGRKINSNSTFGAEVFRVAEGWGIDPYQLADAANQIWREE